MTDITTRLLSMSETMWMDRGQEELDALLLEAKGEIERLREGWKEPPLTCPHIDRALESGALPTAVSEELAAIRDINSQLRYGTWYLKAQVKELEAALKPFAKAGQVIDGPFGPALFREDDMAFQSGCAWSENGERRTITWGDFRRARAALIPQQKGNADGK